jgi:bacteriocin biosynthesis cyclodehydratase domain-containing protein
VTGTPAVKLVAPPLQLIGQDDGIILVRGCVELRISGARAAETVQIVLDATRSGGATRQEIGERFAEPDRAGVAELVEELVRRRLLAPAGSPAAPTVASEGALDVFYWHFGESTERVLESLNARRVAVMGVNTISRQLATSLGAAGVRNVEVVDFHALRNLRLFDDSGGLKPEEWPAWIVPPLNYDDWADGLDPEELGCLVATSDFGAGHLLRDFNEFCVARDRHFLPVVLDRMIGFVGPLVIPGETACYECLRGRENAGMDDPETRRAVEFAAAQRQAVNGFHPSLTAILGEVAALELVKFYSGVMPRSVGRLVEVNLLAVEMRARKVLKLPRCSVCSPVNWRSPTHLDKSAFRPERLERHEGR